MVIEMEEILLHLQIIEVLVSILVGAQIGKWILDSKS